jgi:hypothetical protein
MLGGMRGVWSAVVLVSAAVITGCSGSSGGDVSDTDSGVVDDVGGEGGDATVDAGDAPAETSDAGEDAARDVDGAPPADSDATLGDAADGGDGGIDPDALDVTTDAGDATPAEASEGGAEVVADGDDGALDAGDSGTLDADDGDAGFVDASDVSDTDPPWDGAIVCDAGDASPGAETGTRFCEIYVDVISPTGSAKCQSSTCHGGKVGIMGLAMGWTGKEAYDAITTHSVLWLTPSRVVEPVPGGDSRPVSVLPRIVDPAADAGILMPWARSDNRLLNDSERARINVWLSRGAPFD